MPELVLIDGYTLEIETSDVGVIFKGHHSRKGISKYDDSILIEFLAQKSQDEYFLDCIRTGKVYTEQEDRYSSLTM